MKILKGLLMIITAPVILVLTLFVWLCTGLIYISGLVLGLLALPRNVVPGDRAAARSGAAQPAEHPHGGGFPGAVGSEKSENLAPRDLERNAVHGLEAAETLAQLPDGYDGFIHGASVL